MNKEIFRLLFRIFFSVAFTLVLVLIWSSTKKKSELYDMVINSSNIVKSDYVNFSDVIYRIDDEYASFKLQKNRIDVSNVIDDKVNFMLVLKIDKSSTIDINYLKYTLDDTISYLKDNYMYEDTQFSYYLLSSYLLDIGDSRIIDYLIWLDVNTPDEEISNSLYYAVSVYSNYNF